MTGEVDVLERVARFAPTPSSTVQEWSAGEELNLLSRLTGDRADDVIPLQFVPRRGTGARSARLLPAAASVAVAALVAGVLFAVPSRDGQDSDVAAGGPPFSPPAGLSNRPDVGAHQFSYRVTEQMSLDRTGRPERTSDFAMKMRDYVAPDGRIVSCGPASRPAASPSPETT